MSARLAPRLPLAASLATLLYSAGVHAAPSAVGAAPEPAADQRAAEQRPAEEPTAKAGAAWERHLVLLAQLGFGTPLGYLGLAAEYSLTDWLSLSAGVGTGSGPYCLAPDEQPASYGKICDRWHRDLQYASMLRGRYILKEISAVGFGAGPSLGGYTWVEPLQTDGPAYKSTERAYWLNIEAYLEARSELGLLFRGFVGYGFMLNPGALECVGWGAGARAADHCREDHASDGKRLLYLGFAGGIAL